MNLTSALRVATNSLANNSRQISNLSSNINGVGNANYVRREAQPLAGPHGMQSIDIVRRIDNSLSEAHGVAISKEALQKVVVSAYDRMSGMLGANSGGASLSAGLGQLRDAIDLAAASPGDRTALSALVSKAGDIANRLNDSYSEILKLQAEADRSAAAGVADINDLLGRIKTLNDRVVTTTHGGQPDLDAMDQRDALIKELAGEIGIAVRNRENNDIAIYTNSGLTLFDKLPRAVEFAPINAYGPGSKGNALYVDGVPATGNSSGLAVNSGNTIGHIQARDGVLADQLKRLDEFARGLVEAFAETDQTGGGKSPLAGLFTWSGGPAVPASGSLEPGIAMSITVNPAVDPGQGGNPTLIRDGGIAGDADYLWNTSGGSGFGDRLLDLSQALSASRSFDPSAGLQSDAGLDAFADALVGTLEQDRKDGTDKLEYRGELKLRLEASLRLETGPNLDYEMSQLLEVERAYQASAQLISAVDKLLDSFMASLR